VLLPLLLLLPLPLLLPLLLPLPLPLLLLLPLPLLLLLPDPEELELLPELRDEEDPEWEEDECDDPLEPECDDPLDELLSADSSSQPPSDGSLLQFSGPMRVSSSCAFFSFSFSSGDGGALRSVLESSSSAAPG